MYTRINKDLLDDPRHTAATAEWNRCYPYPDTMLIWDHQKLIGQDGKIYWGHLIEPAIAEKLKLPEQHYLPKTTCLYAVNETYDFFNSSFMMFQEMLGYMKQNGLKPTGDARARKVRSYKTYDGHYGYFAQLWIPV